MDEHQGIQEQPKSLIEWFTQPRTLGVMSIMAQVEFRQQVMAYAALTNSAEAGLFSMTQRMVV